MQPFFIGLWVFLFGLLIGSFLNVCIYRIPQKISVAMGFSYCPSCHHRLMPKDLFPVASYLLLRGSCRYCGAPISKRYPLIETVTGLLFVLNWLRLGFTPMGALTAALLAVLVVITMIDLDLQIIPDGLNLFILVLALPAIFFSGRSLPEHLIGLVAVSLLLFIVAVLSNGGMGGGDIKLMGAAGLFLGWKLILLALIVGSVVGAIISLILLAAKKAGRKTMIPFGPFLSLGIAIAALYGDDLIWWYLMILLT